ncbi:hypothetical protein ACHHYP_13806 [Achlya hypogyna]|uniref:Ankyrin repeat protein n=1 Tax=Achlya hypogyna TaxID=1202772 RepID=A0A1V9ZFF1_ACHHY|nr:hypothetical protein ACHHYP_13806 [Achlya hypogyna]
MDNYENTVWFAAKMGRLEVLRRLVEEDGHAFDAQDDQLKTPFYYACTFNQPEILAYLRQLYITRNVVMPEEQRAWCIVSCLNEDVRLFLEDKITIEEVIATRAKKAHDETLSPVEAAAEGNMTRIRYFVKFEPEAALAPDAATNETPLQAACRAGRAPVVATLLALAKKELTPDAYAAQVANCSVTSDVVGQVLRGELSMKEIMLLEKAATTP